MGFLGGGVAAAVEFGLGFGGEFPGADSGGDPLLVAGIGGFELLAFGDELLSERVGVRGFVVGIANGGVGGLLPATARPAIRVARTGSSRSAGNPVSAARSASGSGRSTTASRSSTARMVASAPRVRAATRSVRPSGSRRRPGADRSACSSSSARTRLMTYSGLPRARCPTQSSSTAGGGCPMIISASSRVVFRSIGVTSSRCRNPSSSSSNSACAATSCPARSAGRLMATTSRRVSSRCRAK